MKETTLGPTMAARVLAIMYEHGDITDQQWRKIGRAYAHFCFVMNEIWLSGIEERVKRHLAQVAFSDAVARLEKTKLPTLQRNYLRNILTTHHKEVCAKYDTQRKIERGVGIRVHRKA